MIRSRLRILVVALPLLCQGCLFDIAPSREPLDKAWMDHMLAGEYGQWFDGERWHFMGRDEIRSSPLLASGTRYGISTSNQGLLSAAGWSMVGGMTALVEQSGARVELFGKQTTRAHGMKRTSGEQDKSYEFFLVVRPNAAEAGRLVKQWSFSAEERATDKYVEGYLEVGPEGNVATITITGLKKPFQERVDFSQKLP